MRALGTVPFGSLVRINEPRFVKRMTIVNGVRNYSSWIRNIPSKEMRNFNNIDDNSIFKSMIWLYFDSLCLFHVGMTERKIRSSTIIFYRHIEYVSYSRFCLKWHCQFDRYFYRDDRDASWFSARRREIIVTQFHCKIFVVRFVDSRIQVNVCMSAYIEE